MVSELADTMTRIVTECSPMLKDSGFRKRRHSLNRCTADGLVHVVNFWMAPSEPPAWTEVPGLRERLYGNFRLDFGVWAPEMDRMGSPRSAWVNEYDCQLRRTMSDLRGHVPGWNGWWPIDTQGAQRAGEVLVEHGLPWLDRFPNKPELLANFESAGALGVGMSRAGSLDIADLYAAVGDAHAARRTLERYAAEPVLPTHAEYLAGYLTERGHGDLVASIVTSD